MINFLLTVVAFVVAISVLVAVHEFGHYWVARRLGVKVLRFSIGFGNPVWRHIGKDADQVEYVVSSIPLGGYVKMLDEREGEVAPEEQHRAFNRQPVAKRFAIVAAGPILNLIFAVFAYWLMFMHGVPGLKPQLGQIPAGSPAAIAGLREGQVILEVDGSQTHTWGEVLEKLLPKALLRESADVVVSDGAQHYTHTLSFDGLSGDEKQEELPRIIGLASYQLPAYIRSVERGSVAERAGLLPGDLVTNVAGEAVSYGSELVAAINRHPSEQIIISYTRNGISHITELTPAAVTEAEKTVGRIGIAVQIYPRELEVTVHYGPVESVGQAVNKAWDNVVVYLKIIKGMILARISPENLSGPITIANYAKSSAVAGFSEFLRFLAVVSLSLGILNLLPIPVLDGGHLAFYLVEMIKGSPVSERVEAIGQRIGLAIILALMTLAIYNDLVRMAG